MKKEFINFLHELMEAAPDVVKKSMTDNIKNYITALESESSSDKPEFTERGLAILKYLKEECEAGAVVKAKDIAEGMGLASKSVVGSIRKLVTDEYVEKIGEKPILYTLTEKGKNYIFED